MSDDIDKIKKEHEDSYRAAIIDIIKNNTNVLVNDDSKMLLNNPPLDSMDVLKSKIIDLAKKNKVVVNTDNLHNIITKYRSSMIKSCDTIIDLRVSSLNKKVNDFKFLKRNDVIKINRKDFNDLNKKIKKTLKNSILECYEKCIDKKFKQLFDNNIDESICNSISDDFNKFFFKNYQKQLFEKVDIKIMVKDTTLMNATKEQGERYLFIINNSRIFSDT